MHGGLTRNPTGFRRPWLGGAGALLLILAFYASGEHLSSLLGTNVAAVPWASILFRALLGMHGLALMTWSRWSEADPPAAPKERTAASTWWIVAGLTILALTLRLWRLNSCLWLDEILTMVDFARPPAGEIISSFPNQNQHMLYSLLAHVSIRWFGESAWALRLPAVLFGAASVPALFLAGRRMLGTTVALFSCALLTVSYHHIWFSQNARGYTGLVFFTLMSTWLWMKAIDGNRWGVWAGYAIACALGVWVHMTMIFVVVAQALVYVVLAGLRSHEAPWRWRAVAAWALAASLSLQLFALALPQFFSSALKEMDMPSEWTNPIWSMLEMVRGLRIGFSSGAVVGFGGVMVLAGWATIVRRSPRTALIMIVPGILGAFSMLAAAHNLWPRFFFFLVGFALLIVIHGALELPGIVLPQKAARLAGFAAVCLIIAASAAMTPRCYGLPKQDFTGARDYVERQRGPGDNVVTLGLAGHAYGKYYAPEWTVVKTPQELQTVQSTHRRTLLVYTLGIELKAFHPDLWRAVEGDFTPLKIFPGTLGGGEVYVCEQRAHPRKVTVQ